MYLRNNKDPRFKIGVLSSQWLLKHSVCIRVAKSEHWTPSSPLPWDLAFHLNSFSNYYSSLQSISAIYHTLLAHLHKKKKTALHVQTTNMEGEPTAKNVQQSGISLNLRTGPTGHAPLFNQWDGALVFINKQIKTSPQSSKSFKTTDGVGQN